MANINLMAGSADGLARQVVSDAPAVISVLLNDRCNLQCSHCYLESMVEPNRMKTDEWGKSFYSLFGDLRPGAVAFAGKEIFVDGESVDVLLDALQTRDELQRSSDRRTDIGAITNGTVVDKYRKILEKSSLDWIDVSIDGQRDFHDKIRGTGAYAKAERNLGWLHERFGNHLWILPTLCDANYGGMVPLMQELNRKFGVGGFSFGIYKDRFSAPNEHSMSYGSVAQFFENLREAPAFENPVTAVFDFTKDLREYSSLFGMPEPNGETITEREEGLGNNVSLRVHRANVPVGLWRAVRISSEGDWLAAEDLMDHQNYKTNAVTNLRSVDYDARKAYEIGLKSDRARKLGVFAEVVV
jgi:hypothetical protein